MNSTSLMDKVELGLYSTLISVLSGVRQLKETRQQVSDAALSPLSNCAGEASPIANQASEMKLSISWDSIQQTLLTTLLWIVLGFAAGFLIGMLRVG